MGAQEGRRAWRQSRLRHCDYDDAERCVCAGIPRPRRMHEEASVVTRPVDVPWLVAGDYHDALVQLTWQVERGQMPLVSGLIELSPPERPPPDPRPELRFNLTAPTARAQSPDLRRGVPPADRPGPGLVCALLCGHGDVAHRRWRCGR